MRKSLLTLVAITLAIPLVSVFAQNTGGATSKTFSVGADTTIMLADDKSGALANLAVGDKVFISYHDQGQSAVAERIHVMGAPKSGSSGKTANHAANKPADDTHAHGAITAIDTTAGTVTIKMFHKREKTTTPPPQN